MSEIWAKRQRQTNKLVRGIAAHILHRSPSGEQLFGLCRLTWITAPTDGDNPAYIRSTKIPALAESLNIDLDGHTLAEAAEAVAHEVHDQGMADLVGSHTGFTNFYKAFRNSARPWAHQNQQALLEIFQRAYALTSDEQGEALTALVAALPPIPKANHPDQVMRPEFLVTPVCFALDGRLRYPIINGAQRVRSLLRRIGSVDSTPVAKYRALVSLIGRGGVKDAADLDQLGLDEQIDILSTDGESLYHLLQELKEEGDDLPSKEESEIERLQLALTINQRRLHNRMTNRLRLILGKWTLHEGRSLDCRYDVLVRNYNSNNNDLLIEVKSSNDASQVRMSIGQVFAYWHKLKGPTDEIHTAILLPSRPDPATEDLLNWLKIGVLWINDEGLFTRTDWLEPIAKLAGTGPVKK